VFPELTLALVGEIDTVIVLVLPGVTVTDEFAFLLVLAVHVAVTVTGVLVLTLGAVNRPLLDMLPAVVDHVTPV
jgi:hypothetical protein